MSKKIKIKNDNRDVVVSDINRLYEIDSDYPPLVDDNRRIFVDNLTLNGDGTTSQMTVDGSTTSQDFILNSVPDFDTHISIVSFYITVETVIASLNEFGGLPSLTNGCEFFYFNTERGRVNISDSINTNLDLLRLSGFKPNFGFSSAGSDNGFKLINSFTSSDEGYFSVIKLDEYGFLNEYTGGLVLKANTNDKLVFRINDDLSGGISSVSRLDARVYGYKNPITN